MTPTCAPGMQAAAAPHVVFSPRPECGAQPQRHAGPCWSAHRGAVVRATMRGKARNRFLFFMKLPQPLGTIRRQGSVCVSLLGHCPRGFFYSLLVSPARLQPRVPVRGARSPPRDLLRGRSRRKLVAAMAAMPQVTQRSDCERSTASRTVVTVRRAGRID